MLGRRLPATTTIRRTLTLEYSATQWYLGNPTRNSVHPSTAGLNLLIADKADPERDALAEAFARRGGTVRRIGRFWDPPAFDPATVRVYGADTFCLVLQRKLGISLCSPADDLLLQAPPQFLRRRLEKSKLSEVGSRRFPAFIKPIVPKQFRGAVYPSIEELTQECRGLPPDTAVFFAEPVTFTSEVRTFVYDGRVLDAAVYEGTEQTRDAIEFVRDLVSEMSIPRAVVVDVGIAARGWAVIEFNPAWQTIGPGQAEFCHIATRANDPVGSGAATDFAFRSVSLAGVTTSATPCN